MNAPDPTLPEAKITQVDPNEIDGPPETFEPFEEWKAKWKPYPQYLTLVQVQEKIGDRDLAEVLMRCQCIGQTIHVEKQIPAEAWLSPHWRWDVEENRCGKPQYSEHLQFQVQVYERDVDAVLEVKSPEAVEAKPAPVERPAPVVEEIEGFQGLPEGWSMRTVEGLAWQVHNADGDLYGPLRVDMALAVGDAWSFQSHVKWASAEPAGS